MLALRLSLLAAAVSLLPLPASASSLTDAFVANAKPNIDFLDKSSRLALDRSHNARVRDYAKDVAARETIVDNTIVAWWQSNTPAGASAALGTPRPLDQKLDPILPLERVTVGLVDGSLLTGRSVAVDTPREAPKPALLPSQDADYAKLETLKGARFDAFYKVTQRNALRQLVALYRDYAASGDDPALRSLSTLQLGASNDLITRLNALR